MGKLFGSTDGGAINVRRDSPGVGGGRMNCPTCGISILGHPANDCLNRWVAEKVMGWNLEYRDGNYSWRTGKRYKAYYFYPSSYIVDTWEVVRKMHKQGYLMDIESGWEKENIEVYNVKFYKPSSISNAFAPTAPLAICRAALLAVMEVSE